jgi:glycosyltransferase involved in cell wall biosynthesis
MLLNRLFTQIQVLRQAAMFDAIIVHKVSPGVWWSSLLKRINPKIVFDFDDAIFLIYSRSVARLVRDAAIVSAGSHFNLRYAQMLNPNSVLLPTPVPFEEFQRCPHMVKDHPDFITIGWIGSFSTMKYLEMLQYPLAEIGRRYPGKIRFIIIGCGNRCHKVPRFVNVEIQTFPRVEPSDVPRHLSTFDIGVMPIFNTDWEQGKCALKALEYMACGVPALCSAVGENCVVIQDGVNGFLAASAEEWVEKLDILISHPDTRRVLGCTGRKTVSDRYARDVCYEILRDRVLNAILS